MIDPLPRRPRALDLYAHTNPAFGALTLHWFASGYADVASEGPAQFAGVHVLWGAVSLALIAPVGVRKELPQTAAKKLGILMREHTTWRSGLTEAVRYWSPHCWEALRFGVTTGVVTVERGRFAAAKRPRAGENGLAKQIQKSAATLGKVFAKEGSDGAVALALGIRVTP